MGVRKIIQVCYLLIGILSLLDVGRSENDEDTRVHQQRGSSKDNPKAGNFENFVVWQTSDGKRQVTIKSGMAWVQETATWEIGEEEIPADYVIRQVTDGSSRVAAVLDGHGRLRECHISHDYNIAEQFISDINRDHTLCAHVPDETPKLRFESDNIKGVDGSSLLYTNLFLTSLKDASSTGLPQCKIFSNVLLPSQLLNFTSLINDCQQFLSSVPHSSDRTSNFLDHGNFSFSDLHHPGHRRSRRSLMYPGTLWCGAGHRAKSEYALGDNTFTDRCCRAHDFCPMDMQILAFKTKYYMTNKNMFTLSHCACDKRFHKCLRQVRNAVSYDVGNMYFNILTSQCFVVRQKKQCVENGWWGKCNRYEKRPTALLRQPRAFPKSLKRNRSGRTRKNQTNEP
ncbi:uncharacterized protein LOC105445152 [Strongylocentrotus purpuratus]|uniref:Phospholipase A2-like central domain-containing protein n=1 Tax=Strongylocentrotus purpuratus TaxID=7668 RepID=A0A7M7HL93_STRPU|nr:uncharacterized protein LOC105445152 [Strongylocentrotus purpuratus]|eukprot:XP_011678633.1 PREDICTED: uncharacterized protein LOC105445152 [Strongylocentrotus purpuratus]